MIIEKIKFNKLYYLIAPVLLLIKVNFNTTIINLLLFAILAFAYVLAYASINVRINKYNANQLFRKHEIKWSASQKMIKKLYKLEPDNEIVKALKTYLFQFNVWWAYACLAFFLTISIPV